MTGKEYEEIVQEITDLLSEHFTIDEFDIDPLGEDNGILCKAHLTKSKIKLAFCFAIGDSGCLEFYIGYDVWWPATDTNIYASVMLDFADMLVAQRLDSEII